MGRRRTAGVVLLFVASACGRINFGQDGSVLDTGAMAPDAASDAPDAASDASADASDDVVDGSAGATHIIFVSTERLPGQLAVGEADAACQRDATAASLPGQFRALLSTTSEPSGSRLAVTRAVVNTRGEQVAAGAAQFWSTTHEAAVGYDAAGAAVSDSVWTGSLRDGSPTRNCADWSDPAGRGMVGSPTAANSSWIEQAPRGCDVPRPVYCVSD